MSQKVAGLKKDFQERDVQRLRNLIQGKYGEKTRSSVGFTNKQEFHKEGDVWVENGRTWTIEDGIKQMQTLLINRADYVRSTYIPRSQGYGINAGF